jgi:hypothetical protein
VHFPPISALSSRTPKLTRSRAWLPFRGIGAQAAAPVDRAIADLDVVIKADPKNPPLIHERGAMKAKMGDFRRAEALTCGPAAPERPR